MPLPTGGLTLTDLAFRREDKLLILADAGGSNNCRYWLWKQQVQEQLADQFGIEVMICHYPTGASKWNPIEYRLFSQISRNWAGKPLCSWDMMLNYIRGTLSPKPDCKVKAFLVDRIFEKRKRSRPKKRLHFVCNDGRFVRLGITLSSLVLAVDDIQL